MNVYVFIMEKIQELGEPVYNPNDPTLVDDWKESFYAWKQSFEAMLQGGFQYADALPMLLRFVCDHLRVIEKSKEHYIQVMQNALERRRKAQSQQNGKLFDH